MNRISDIEWTFSVFVGSMYVYVELPVDRGKLFIFEILPDIVFVIIFYLCAALDLLGDHISTCSKLNT